jgi:hypothetical protein
MNVTGSVSIVVDLVASKTIATGLTPSVPVRKTFSWPITNGTGADQANELYVAERTVPTGATDSLDFSGTLTDLFGDTFVLAKLKMIAISNRTTSTTNLTIQRPAGATGVPIFGAVSDALAPLTPGNAMCVWYRAAAGIGVTTGTADIIEVVNSAGASNTYDIIALGTDA